MYRYEIINALIEKYGYQTYLEIGLSASECFDRIVAPFKSSVDIVGEPTYLMSSDDFFERNDKFYDLIFIDGDHTEEVAERDILNALRARHTGGCIVVHDTNPPVESMTGEDTGGAWFGGVWRAIVRLRATDEWLRVVTVDTDCGVTIIRFGSSTPLDAPDDLTFGWFDQHRTEALNLISVEEFKESL